ncbi:MAG: O-antigen ligase family protein [Anaerolineae bacterium]|nr:O-antigen ligase family protein [Anaerolineae bacterium]
MTQAAPSNARQSKPQVEINPTVGSGLLYPILTASAIYFITVIVGVWAAPDRSAAFNRLMLFMLGFVVAGGIVWGARTRVETALGSIGLFFGFLAVLLTFHFLVTTNWAESGAVRLPLFGQIGLWIHNNTRTWSEMQNLQKNITGGILVILFPLTLTGSVWAWSRRYLVIFSISIVMLCLMLFGLIMSVSRGAWLGFAFAIVFAPYFYWRFEPGNRSIFKWIGDFLAVATVGLLIYGFYLVITVPQYSDYMNAAFNTSKISRIDLWRDSLSLIQDYWYTGSGLGSTDMVYSSYVFSLHVPFLTHAHNLFMQIAIEQGVPGLIAFVSVTIFTILSLIDTARHGDQTVRFYSACVLASIVAMLIHGIVESNLYAYQLVPVMFLPFGFALALLLSRYGTSRIEPASVRDKVVIQRVAVFGTLFPSVVIGLLFIWPGSMATLQANLGAVAQTRAELAVYVWPEWPLQDELRRMHVVDLSNAIRHYKTALALNPDNVTALRRLGQIEISMGDYDTAQQHLEAAYRIAPHQRATRQMLGELYAISGNTTEAVKLWQPLDVGQQQLDIRYWWYAHIEADEQATLIKQAVTQFENQ